MVLVQTSVKVHVRRAQVADVMAFVGGTLATQLMITFPVLIAREVLPPRAWRHVAAVTQLAADSGDAGPLSPACARASFLSCALRGYDAGNASL